MDKIGLFGRKIKNKIKNVFSHKQVTIDTAGTIVDMVLICVAAVGTITGIVLLSVLDGLRLAATVQEVS